MDLPEKKNHNFIHKILNNSIHLQFKLKICVKQPINEKRLR